MQLNYNKFNDNLINKYCLRLQLMFQKCTQQDFKPKTKQSILRHRKVSYIETKQNSKQEVGKKQIAVKIYSNKFLRESRLGKDCLHYEQNLKNYYCPLPMAIANRKKLSTSINAGKTKQQLQRYKPKNKEHSSKNLRHQHIEYRIQPEPIDQNEELGIFDCNILMEKRNQSYNKQLATKKDTFYAGLKMQKQELSLSRALEFFSCLAREDHSQLLQKLKTLNNKQSLEHRMLHKNKKQQVSLRDISRKILFAERAERRSSVCSSYIAKRVTEVSRNDNFQEKDSFQLKGWEVGS